MMTSIPLHFPIHETASARTYERSKLVDESAIESAVAAAGAAVATALYDDFREVREWPAEPRLLVMCGKGLNAADAVLACAGLAERMDGLRVCLVAGCEREDWHPLLETAYRRLEALLGDRLEQAKPGNTLPEGPLDVVMDGLYGLNFRAPVRPEIRELLRRVEALPSVGLRVAIDLPSGVGENVDPSAFVADFTYMIGVSKKAAFSRAARVHVGRVRFLPLEIFSPDRTVSSERIVNPTAFKRLPALRSADADKRSFGHGLILAGSLSMPGAAQMSTFGALQAGAGLVTTLTPMEVATALASAAPEAMWRPVPLNREGGVGVEAVQVVSGLASRAQAMLIGPGLPVDRSTRFTVARLVRETPLALILDASALFPEILSAVSARPASAGPVILTPHRGEWERFTRGPESGEDIGEALRQFSLKYRVTVLLKGAPSLIAHDGKLLVACAGGPVLSRGGSGDILAGILLAQLALTPSEPVEALCRAVTWHGAAADALAREKGQNAVRTTDLLDYLSPVLRS